MNYVRDPETLYLSGSLNYIFRVVIKMSVFFQQKNLANVWKLSRHFDSNGDSDSSSTQLYAQFYMRVLSEQEPLTTILEFLEIN